MAAVSTAVSTIPATRSEERSLPDPPAAAELSSVRESASALARGIPGAFRLAGDDLARALGVSPVLGFPELRRRWRERQRRGISDTVPSTLPIVTMGLTHALSLAADLFAGEGRAVAIPTPFWGNYRQAFAVRAGARLATAPAYAGGRFAARFSVDAVPRALAGLPAGEPAVAILNLPSNPGGYSPDAAERRDLLAGLVAEAGRRPLVVLCDDAYAGLVYEEEIPRASLFWDLVGAHPDLLAVKIDGGTKEFSFFGGRVGFLTFGLPEGSAAARTLTGQVERLAGATVGAPPASSQAVLLEALRRDGVEREIEAVRALLARRYRTLKEALSRVDAALLRPLPFNSGCFALVELPEELGISSEEARRHLLDHQGVGLISIAPRYLRIAHCSVEESALPELVSRLEQGIAALASEPKRKVDGQR